MEVLVEDEIETEEVLVEDETEEDAEVLVEDEILESEKCTKQLAESAEALVKFHFDQLENALCFVVTVFKVKKTHLEDEILGEIISLKEVETIEIFRLILGMIVLCTEPLARTVEAFVKFHFDQQAIAQFFVMTVL